MRLGEWRDLRGIESNKRYPQRGLKCLTPNLLGFKETTKMIRAHQDRS